jgi:hypothetical protein
VTGCGPVIVVQDNGSVTRTVVQSSPVVTQNTGSVVVVQRTSSPVLTTETQTIAQPIVQTQIIKDITVGPQGPPGESGSSTFPVTAGENLTYPIIVAIDNGVCHAADPTNTTDMSSQLAVTTQSAMSGATIEVAVTYSMTEPMWSWTPGRVYLALSGGQITQTPDPTIGAILEVGRAVSATTIEFNVQTAILR